MYKILSIFIISLFSININLGASDSDDDQPSVILLPSSSYVGDFSDVEIQKAITASLQSSGMDKNTDKSVKGLFDDYINEVKSNGVNNNNIISQLKSMIDADIDRLEIELKDLTFGEKYASVAATVLGLLLKDGSVVTSMVAEQEQGNPVVIDINDENLLSYKSLINDDNLIKTINAIYADVNYRNIFIGEPPQIVTDLKELGYYNSVIIMANLLKNKSNIDALVTFMKEISCVPGILDNERITTLEQSAQSYADAVKSEKDEKKQDASIIAINKIVCAMRYVLNAQGDHSVSLGELVSYLLKFAKYHHYRQQLAQKTVLDGTSNSSSESESESDSDSESENDDNNQNSKSTSTFIPFSGKSRTLG